MKKLFSIGFLDIMKAALLAAVATLITSIITFANLGIFPLYWLHVNTAGQIVHGWDVPVYTALSTFLAYLLKNFFTNSENKFATPEPPAQS